MPQALPDKTVELILQSAWQLIVETGRSQVSLAEIARAAGVSRQSVYLACGNRAGLLVAMARHADQRSIHSRRMAAIADGTDTRSTVLLDFARAWLAHLPEIYPVGILLIAAAATDADAAAVLQDRLVGSLHHRYWQILSRLHQRGLLHPDWSAERAADWCWSLTHLDAWKHLVVERGWSAEAFVADRLQWMARLLR